MMFSLTALHGRDYTLVKLMEKYRLAISERDRRIFYKSLLEKPADTGSWLNKRFESSPLSFDISASIETALNIKLKTAVAR